MFDDDNAYDNPGGTSGGSDTPSAGSDNGAGAELNTFDNPYSTARLNLKPFGSQNSGHQQQPGQPDWMRGNGPVNFHSLPESIQYYIYKTAQGSPGNDGGKGLFDLSSGADGLGTNLSASGSNQNSTQGSSREDFIHNGQSYYKENGNTYMLHPEVTGGVIEVHPDRAAEIDRQRAEERDRQEKEKARLEEQAKLDAEKWRRPTAEEAADQIETFDTIAKYGAGTIGGILAIPSSPPSAALARIGISQGVGAALDLTKKKRIESYQKEGLIPIIEKMTPEEILSSYGRR